MRGDIARDETDDKTFFTEQGAPASDLTAAKDVIPRFPEWSGPPGDAGSAKSRSR